MSSPRPLEHKLLSPVERVLHDVTTPFGSDRPQIRLEVLEAVASRLGGCDLGDLRSQTKDSYILSATQCVALAAPVARSLADVPIPAPLALASLARPVLSTHAQRTGGVYYTDFRLASYLATRTSSRLQPDAKVIDAACGTGILLAAMVLAVCGDDPEARTNFIANGICGADVSSEALRGARIALSSLTSDADAVARLGTRLRVQDSLISGSQAWADVAPEGFSAVVGNPPWEKVKVTRHEFLRAAGLNRHYGDDYALNSVAADADIAKQRAKAASYALAIGERYPLANSGELDLYKAFFALALELVNPNGTIGLLVPAGLIRSQGTEPLRRQLLAAAAEVDIAIVDNRANFFSIDTRFKFLVVTADFAGLSRGSVTLRHARGTTGGVEETGKAAINRRQLEAIRQDLTIPEVRTSQEWRLFRTLSSIGVPFGSLESGWGPQIAREVDMTRDKKLFIRAPGRGRLPLIEGRMVHQFRLGAKAYVSGTGRRAVWRPLPPGQAEMEPQYWVRKSDLPASTVARCEARRVGFCDITGQTNERTLLSAIIPSGVVCGNKVPTITFCGWLGSNELAMDLWVAIANSFVFDWLARRVVTTTVNFFLLLGLPFPRLTPFDEVGRRIAALAVELSQLDVRGVVDPWEFAVRRAAIDALVAAAYGLGVDEMALVLNDFPLLDKAQPPIDSEASSTVTRDLVLAELARALGEPDEEHRLRVKKARDVGAVAYIPAQYASFVRAR